MAVNRELMFSFVRIAETLLLLYILYLHLCLHSTLLYIYYDALRIIILSSARKMGEIL